MTPVDAHLHFWDRDRFRYPWLDDLPDLPISATPDLLARERATARAGLFVQADCLAEQGAAEARWASQVTGGEVGLAGIIAFAAVERGPAVEEDLAGLAEIPLVAGVRQLIQDEPDEFLLSPELQAGLLVVGAHGLVFDACVRSHQLTTLIQLRRAAAGTRFVIDHLGKPPLRDGIGSAAGVAWQRDIRALAGEPDTYVKLSGLGVEADPDRPLKEQAAPFLSVALEAFGAERAMAGSDWPVSTYGSYDDWFDLLVEVLGPTPGEWASLSVSTATAAYHLGSA
jgi:L-fuconolactonase